MATKRVLESVRLFNMQGSSTTVNAPYAEAALLDFLNGSEIINIRTPTQKSYMRRECVCQVDEGTWTEEEVADVPCESVDCIPDYVKPTPAPDPDPDPDPVP